MWCSSKSEIRYSTVSVHPHIHHIYIYNDNKFMIIKLIAIHSHIQAFKVTVTDQSTLFHTDDLYCHGVLHLKQQGPHLYLVEKDNWVKPTVY